MIEKAENPFEVMVLEINLEKSNKTVDVALHGVPVHADDAVCLKLISREATPGWIKGNSTDGVIRLDTLESKFSDKAPGNLLANGKKKEAMCMKVARSLGVLKNPKWEKILAAINRDDINAGTDQTSIISLLKHGQQQNPRGVLALCEWFTDALFAKLEFDNGSRDFTLKHMSKIMDKEWIKTGQTINKLRSIFFRKATEELYEKNREGKALLETINYNGKTIKVAAIESFNYLMQTAMRNRLADVVIVKSPRGVFINSRAEANIDMREVIAVIRFREAWEKGVKLNNDWRLLRKNGTIDEAPEWFLNITATPITIMNSLSHDAPMTALSWPWMKKSFTPSRR